MSTDQTSKWQTRLFSSRAGLGQHDMHRISNKSNVFSRIAREKSVAHKLASISFTNFPCYTKSKIIATNINRYFSEIRHCTLSIVNPFVFSKLINLKATNWNIILQYSMLGYLTSQNLKRTARVWQYRARQQFGANRRPHGMYICVAFSSQWQIIM